MYTSRPPFPWKKAGCKSRREKNQKRWMPGTSGLGSRFSPASGVRSPLVLACLPHPPPRDLQCRVRGDRALALTPSQFCLLWTSRRGHCLRLDSLYYFWIEIPLWDTLKSCAFLFKNDRGAACGPCGVLTHKPMERGLQYPAKCFMLLLFLDPALGPRFPSF